MKPERVSLGADLALLAVAAVWGLTFTAVQRALDAAGPFSFLAVRFSLAAIALAVAFPRRALRYNRRLVLVGVLLGVWLTVGYSLQTVGLLYTTASRSAFITGLCVVLVPPLSMAVSRARPGPGSLVGVGLGAAGLFLLTSPKSGGINLGDLLTLGCALGFALHIVTAERAAPSHDALPLAFWQVVTTAVLSGVLLGLAETPRLPLTRWTIFALSITGLLATAVAFAVQMWAQRRTTASHVAIIFTAEPVFAALFAWAIQHEVLGLKGLLGGGLIIAGILTAQLTTRPRPLGDETIAQTSATT